MPAGRGGAAGRLNQDTLPTAGVLADIARCSQQRPGDDSAAPCRPALRSRGEKLEHTRRSRTRWQSALALAVGIATFGLVPLAQAQRGYDKEEKPTGIWQGYCLPLEYKLATGLCAGYEGTRKVCSASIDGDNHKSAKNWLDTEVYNIRAVHTDKTLVKGSQAFNTLQNAVVGKACKQISPNTRLKTGLTDSQKTEAACNFVWRRDQEIQDEMDENMPGKGYPWGTFRYKPPGKNDTTFIFKGIPKQQCEHDYECRKINTPGEVYTSCDYCEAYFNSFCDTDTATVFKFCMEKVHCVCNSVLKPCAKPKMNRCPKQPKPGEKGAKCGTGSPFPKGMYFPLHGAPAADASTLSALMAWPSFILATLVVRLQA